MITIMLSLAFIENIVADIHTKGNTVTPFGFGNPILNKGGKSPLIG